MPEGDVRTDPIDLLADLPAADPDARNAAAARDAILTKPPGALGRLEGLIQWLAAWQGRARPRLDRVQALVFAGNHGIATQGVSAYPAEVTAQMVANFEAGGAAVNQLCKAFGVALSVHPLELETPTGDITRGPALDHIGFRAAIDAGARAVPTDADLVCIGEMGIANTAVAATVCLGLFGGRAEDWTGPGTGVEGPALDAKARAVASAVTVNRADLDAAGNDALETLRILGGRELAAMAGAVAAARRNRQPVLLDGFVAGAAAACLMRARPDALDHCRAAHVSAEPGHRRLLAELRMTPLLDLEMRLGEASGAVLAVALTRAALACFDGMATFDEAQVSGKA